jgi:glycosyltransferase involved in cell wall biosynthesis
MALSSLKAIASWLRGQSDTADALARYLVAAHPSAFRRQLLRAALATADRGMEDTQTQTRLIRSVILKTPQSPAERGVLLVSFESEIEKLARSVSFPRLEASYQIVFVPTWQPFYAGSLFRFVRVARRPFFLMPSAARDAALCQELSPLCEALPFQSSSWVSSSFGRAGAVRNIDLLMLANFSKYKRHWRLFEAVGSMPRETRVVVAGRPLGGRTLGSLRAEAAAFGAEQRIEFVENPSDDEVEALLERTRVLFAPSHKEGSYIGVVEAMMAGAAVAMYDNAQIGSREYVNERTGFFLSPRRPLAPQLMACLAATPERDPAAWARANCSAEVNVERWNGIMRERSRRSGEPWTVEIPRFFCRNFEFFVSEPQVAAALRAEEDRCAREFGVTVARGRQ